MENLLLLGVPILKHIRVCHIKGTTSIFTIISGKPPARALLPLYVGGMGVESRDPSKVAGHLLWQPGCCFYRALNPFHAV